MMEEAFAYRVDRDGSVHYRIDVAFHENADSVVAALSVEPFAAARACINNAVKQLTKVEPEGKHAIRDIFEGVETVFKVETETNKNLAVANIASQLTPIVDRRFAGADAVAKGAAAQSIESLKDWTNA